MLKSIEGNFDNLEVNELLTKHFIELRAASPEGSAHVLDIPGLKVSSIVNAFVIQYKLEIKYPNPNIQPILKDVHFPSL